MERKTMNLVLANGVMTRMERIRTREEIRTGLDPYSAVEELWNMGYRGAGLNLGIPSNRLPVGTMVR